MEGELLRWLPWVWGGLREGFPAFAGSKRPTCGDPRARPVPLQTPQGPGALSPQTVGGPAFFCLFLHCSCHFSLGNQTRHFLLRDGSNLYRFPGNKYGFFRASEVFCACPSPASRATHTSSYEALVPVERSPRSPATAFSKLCIWKLVEELMP